MDSTPVLPRAGSASREDATRALGTLRRFHLGDPSARRLAPVRDLLPALLHSFRDPGAVRSDFPVYVAAGGGACTSIAELLQAGIERSAGSPDRARILADNLRRAERLARREVGLRGGRTDVHEVLGAVGKALIEELALAPEPTAQLRAQWDGMQRAVPEGGELLGLDRKTSMHLLLAAARAVAPARRAAFAAEVVRLRDGLRALLEVERAKDPDAHGAEAVRGAVGQAGAKLFDPAALARVIGSHRGTARLDPRRRARIEEALAVLEEHAAPSTAALLTVVHDPGRDPGVVDRALRCVAMHDPCSAAANLFDVEAERHAIVFRAVRTARLELDGVYDPERHDPWLEALDWEGFSRDEILLVPTVVALESSDQLSGERMLSLSRLLLSGRPVQVLAMALPGADPAASPDDPHTSYRFELGYLGIGHREAFVQQATAARPAHLADGFARALGCARASLHVVATGLDRDGHAPEIGAWLHAGASIEGRAHPLFRYDPEAGATWARRLDFAGNPAPEDDWPADVLRWRDADGAEMAAPLRFTFADFALLEPELQTEFALVDAGLEDPALAPVDEVLALDPADAAHKVPFVRGVDAEGNLHRVALSRRLVTMCRDRLDFWRTLQELAGVRNEHVREAVARARESAAAEADAERERLLAAHAAEIERVREEAFGEAMGGLARSLLELGPDALTVGAPSAPRPRAVEPAPAVQSTVEVAPAPAPAAAEPEVTFEEPWIDTVLCTSCNDCRNLNPMLFVYDENKQARIGDPKAGTFRQLVTAAEKCPARCIHPGLPLDPSESGLEELVARAAPFNR